MIALFVIMWIFVIAYAIDEQDDEIKELKKQIKNKNN